MSLTQVPLKYSVDGGHRHEPWGLHGTRTIESNIHNSIIYKQPIILPFDIVLKVFIVNCMKAGIPAWNPGTEKNLQYSKHIIYSISNQ